MPASPAPILVRLRARLGLAVAALVVTTTVVILLPTAPASAVQAPIDLGTAVTYSVLASGAVTNGGASVYPGNVGVSPGSNMTGMDSANVGGRIDVNNPAAAQAQHDLTTAYRQVQTLTNTDVIDGDLGGRTITPGIYYAAGALGMSGTLTFDAQGNPDAYFIFQVNAALNTVAASKMVLINGAQSSRIFWQTVGAITLGAKSSFVGTMLSNAAMTIGDGCAVTGRVLTFNGAITIAATDVTPIFPDPKADDTTTSQGSAVRVNVLTNDASTANGAAFSLGTLSQYPQLIGGAAGPTPGSAKYGSVSCETSGADRGICTYQPISSFVGVDGFDYAITQTSQQWNVHVTIVVTASTHIPIARADRAVATVGGANVTLLPLANDSAPDGAGLTITGVAALDPAQGSLQCSSTQCSYQPSPTFTGTVATSYSVVSAGGTVAATGTITIFVDAAPIAMQGFSSTVSTAVGSSIGSFTTSSVITSVDAACVSGRASSNISWQSAPDATTFVLQRRSAGSGPGQWSDVATVQASVTTYTDDLVGTGQSYQWRVRPDLERWPGVFSPASTAVTEPAAAASGSASGGC